MDSKPKLITPSVEQASPDNKPAIDVSNNAPPLMQQPQVAGLDGAPVNSGSKHWLIMGGLCLLIIAGIVLLVVMKKSEEEERVAQNEAAAAAVQEEARNYKPEKRPSVPTDERPFKKEMAHVAPKEIDALNANLKKWVFLKGKVKTSNEDGLIVFERALDQRHPIEAQLVRGATPEVEGKEITVIGWLIDPGHLQIDGPEDVDIELPDADTPKLDIYSVDDFDLLKDEVGGVIVLQGRVKETRYSQDKECYHLVFEAGDHDILASGVISMFETGMTPEVLEQYEGKMIAVRGELRDKTSEDNYRIYVNYSRLRHIKLME